MVTPSFTEQNVVYERTQYHFVHIYLPVSAIIPVVMAMLLAPVEQRAAITNVCAILDIMDPG